MNHHSLYPWQEECLAAWFSNHGRGIVQAVTGSGKTRLALEAAYRLNRSLTQKLNVYIVVPSGALMRQWEKELRHFLEATAQPENEKSQKHLPAPKKQIGLRGNGCKDRPDCPYMIYVINSARYELARQILQDLNNGDAVLLIADECHHYKSGQNQLIFEFLPYIRPDSTPFFSLGLSATLPSGEDGRYLTSVLGRKIYSYGMENALKLHTVCPYDIIHIALSFTREERTEYDDLTEKMNHLYRSLLQISPALRKAGKKECFDILRELSASKRQRTADMASSWLMLSYQRKKLVCLASARISCATALIRRLAPGEKIMVFGERIQQAEELYQHLHRQYPERVGRIHSQMGAQANKNILERFRSGDIRILIACKAVDEGVDIPDAAIGIILSGTSAQRQRIQRLGRIIRKNEGKSRASLYYLHISETSEDVCFLPDSRDIRVVELDYRTNTGEFFCPDYEKKAARLLAKLQHAGADEIKMQEARRCLRLGCVRTDWMLPGEILKEQADRASCTSEKNYWNCMNMLKNC